MSQNNLDQLEDLEIYIASRELNNIELWLTNAFDQFTITKKGKKGFHFNGIYQAQTCSGMVVLNAGNSGYTSVWTENRNTPWENDVMMGRAAQQALNTTVRCIESAWEKGDDPDQWLEISNDGEQVIQWVTG